MPLLVRDDERGNNGNEAKQVGSISAVIQGVGGYRQLERVWGAGASFAAKLSNTRSPKDSRVVSSKRL